MMKETLPFYLALVTAAFLYPSVHRIETFALVSRIIH